MVGYFHIRTPVFLIVAIAISALSTQEGRGESIAILGDSTSTGAATHPALVFDSVALWSILRGETSVEADVHGESLRRYNILERPAMPTVLRRSSREFYDSAEWVFLNFLSILSQRYLNTEQYSWGYLVGSSLGLAPQDIWIGAENGARVEQLLDQTDRLLTAHQGVLPNKIFIFFSGNDLCAQRPDLTTSPEMYGGQLQTALDYLRRNGKPAAAGTKVYILGFMGILQLLTQPTILDKEVKAFGKAQSCRQLREGGYEPDLESLQRGGATPEAVLFARLLPPNPARMCPTLFAPAQAVKGHLEEFGNKIRSYRKRSVDVVTNQNKLAANSGFSFHYISATEALNFSPEQIAGDCFHLSLSGQSAVADAVLKELATTL